MLPISTYRKLLGGAVSAGLTDQQIENLREGMYALARLGCNSIGVYKSETSYENAAITTVPERLRDAAEERAAILQFDGGLSRAKAFETALATLPKKGRAQ